MKISDYIVQFLCERNVRVVFGYPGGMVTHLMDSLYQNSQIQACLLYHEQGVSFAACGYSQVLVGQPTMAYATSGPGATNMITGICNAWFDSIPVLFITGQVNTYEGRTSDAVRQKGFQETDICSIVRSVTKYTTQVVDANDIRYELEKSWTLATSGRAGPVLLDIPMNIFRADIDPAHLRGFDAAVVGTSDAHKVAEAILEAIKQAEKPCILLGNGAHVAAREKLALLLKNLGVPYVCSLPAVDLGALNKNCYFGMIGSYGCRTANQVLENCSLIISLGSRLGMRQTGFDRKLFATHAKLIRIDIDENELNDPIKEDETSYCIDLAEILDALLSKSECAPAHEKWVSVCHQIHQIIGEIDAQLPNEIVSAISRFTPEDAIITTDVGQNQIWVAQSFVVQPGQRILFSAGLGAMGYSVPAAIGACLASGKTVLAFCGDGGLQMNIQELQTIVRDQIPVKIILMNNHSLGMIRHFQELYFEDRNAYTVPQDGYVPPDFAKIARAYGLRYYSYDGTTQEELASVLADGLPAFVEVALSAKTYTKPKSVYNKPLSYQLPCLEPVRQNELDTLLGEPP